MGHALWSVIPFIALLLLNMLFFGFHFMEDAYHIDNDNIFVTFISVSLSTSSFHVSSQNSNPIIEWAVPWFCSEGCLWEEDYNLSLLFKKQIYLITQFVF